MKSRIEGCKDEHNESDGQMTWGDRWVPQRMHLSKNGQMGSVESRESWAKSIRGGLNFSCAQLAESHLILRSFVSKWITSTSVSADVATPQGHWHDGSEVGRSLTWNFLEDLGMAPVWISDDGYEFSEDLGNHLKGGTHKTQCNMFDVIIQLKEPSSHHVTVCFLGPFLVVRKSLANIG